MYVWEGGEHPFKLRIGELRALQASTGVGPLFLFGRIVGHQWFVDDIVDTIRLGLIGGGMSEKDAKALTDRVFNENTSALYKHVLLATKILKDAVTGEPDDPVGDEGESKTENETQPDGSSSPISTPPVKSWASRLATLIN